MPKAFGWVAPSRWANERSNGKTMEKAAAIRCRVGTIS